MPRFVEITVHSDQVARAATEAVVRACPVDIFASDGGALSVRSDRVDECILCGQCVQAGGGGVVVRRAYGPRRIVEPARFGNG